MKQQIEKLEAQLKELKEVYEIEQKIKYEASNHKHFEKLDIVTNGDRIVVVEWTENKGIGCEYEKGYFGGSIINGNTGLFMDDIIKFSNQLHDTIEENETLKERLKITEEWLKLAICLTGSLQFRTIEKTDKETYQYFIENTVISNGGNSCGGMQLIWSKQIPLTFEGRTVLGLTPVKMEEIDEIFNGIKIDKR